MKRKENSSREHLLYTLDDVLHDARTTLHFHLKLFLYILRPTYNTFFVI